MCSVAMASESENSFDNVRSTLIELVRKNKALHFFIHCIFHQFDFILILIVNTETPMRIVGPQKIKFPKFPCCQVSRNMQRGFFAVLPAI